MLLWFVDNWDSQLLVSMHAIHQPHVHNACACAIYNAICQCITSLWRSVLNAQAQIPHIRKNNVVYSKNFAVHLMPTHGSPTWWYQWYFNSYCNYYSWLQNQNFHTGASAYRNSFHPFPLGSYYNCFGNESSLSDCQSTSSSSCDSNDAARVYCGGDVITGAYVAIACHVYTCQIITNTQLDCI